ncbi:hypothetical protein ARMSODRAFT_1088689 [Armillaria solidipes]|uniref:Uncharacterized protein n=1 Tax=Armillaria solidipes TaxID=1076256 RepID=A0A2H3BH17_9AGAR|nr:hypothetical protein ARMSODRAFT_1088689 [Armillaria solidipes]
MEFISTPDLAPLVQASPELALDGEYEHHSLEPRSPTPESESAIDTAPQILKLFFEEVERDLKPGGEMELDLTPECKKWLDYDNFCAMTEHIRGRAELMGDRLFVTGAESATHQAMYRVLFDLKVSGKLHRNIYVNTNTTYPVWKQGYISPRIAIYSRAKDLWPLFLIESAYSDSRWKSLRNVLQALLGCDHESAIGGGCALNICLTDNVITRIEYSIIAFRQEGTLYDKKHDDLVSFQLYAKPPHPQGQKGQWIATDGSHVEMGTKYRMLHPTNASGGRCFAEAINIGHGIIDEDHLTGEDDIFLDPAFFDLPEGSERIHLQAKDIWYYVRHEEELVRIRKRKATRDDSEETGGSFVKYRRRIGGQCQGSWDPVSRIFTPAPR